MCWTEISINPSFCYLFFYLSLSIIQLIFTINNFWKFVFKYNWFSSTQIFTLHFDVGKRTDSVWLQQSWLQVRWFYLSCFRCWREINLPHVVITWFPLHCRNSRELALLVINGVTFPSCMFTYVVVKTSAKYMDRINVCL